MSKPIDLKSRVIEILETSEEVIWDKKKKTIKITFPNAFIERITSLLKDVEREAYHKGFVDGENTYPEPGEDDFYVCPHHQSTGGFESCCACTGNRLCSEAPEDHLLEQL